MLRVRDIMTTEIDSIDAESDLRQTVDFLLRHRVTGAPVVAGGEVVGVVSTTDLLEFVQAAPPAPATGPRAAVLWEEGGPAPGAYYVEWWTQDRSDPATRLRQLVEPDRLRRHLVTEVMSRSLCAVSPDATITSAADYMLRAGVHRVLVLDGRTPAGILSTTDIVRAVGQGRLGPVPTPAGS